MNDLANKITGPVSPPPPRHACLSTGVAGVTKEACRHEYLPGQMHCRRCGHRMCHKTWLFKIVQEIRNSYPDGVPLSRADRRIVLGVLRKHPEGRRKFGPGIGDVFVHRYVGGTRCFWAVHPDGSVEDFSVKRALGRGQLRRSPKIAEAMAGFDTSPVIAAYRRHRTGRGQR